MSYSCSNNSKKLNNKEQQILNNLKSNITDSITFSLIMDTIHKYYKNNNLLLSEAYLLYSKFYSETNNDSSNYYLEKSIEISQRNKFDTILIDLLMYKHKSYEDVELSFNDLYKADSLANALNDTLRIAKVNQLLASKYYRHKPKECEKYYEIAYRNFMLVKDTVNAGYCIQNIGFAYGEQLNEYEKSAKYIERAYSLWIEKRNVFQQANLKKYLGICYSKLQNFGKAKADILEGIDKFYSIYDTSGVAVCLYDLSIVYEEEKNLDSAIFYQQKSKEYWYKKKDIGRLFAVNNNLFLNYIHIGNKVKAEMYYNENVEFLKNMYMSSILTLYFYNNCITYFTILNDTGNVFFYNEKLQRYKDDLAKNGIAIPKLN
ncbi:MAG: hypothetical protein A2033_05545 [Bacteroidetes bacterium GWA2_31_9]|nr:MAG: hypothetical protein A2033_05545 [Bacteroidetes bacterium GWA2_31_9]